MTLIKTYKPSLESFCHQKTKNHRNRFRNFQEMYSSIFQTDYKNFSSIDQIMFYETFFLSVKSRFLNYETIKVSTVIGQRNLNNILEFLISTLCIQPHLTQHKYYD